MDGGFEDKGFIGRVMRGGLVEVVKRGALRREGDGCCGGSRWKLDYIARRECFQECL